MGHRMRLMILINNSSQLLIKETYNEYEMPLRKSETFRIKYIMKEKLKLCVCVCVCVYVCMYVCVYIYIYIYTHIYAYTLYLTEVSTPLTIL